MPRVATDARALTDVEKAIKAHDKAVEKAVVAQEKADAAYESQKRAERELKWYANHPDLPEDFDLNEFRRSLEQPFEDPADDDVDHVEPDEGEVAAVAEAEAEEDNVLDDNAVEPEPEPDEEPAPTKARRTGKTRPAPEPVDDIDDDDPFGGD